MDVVVNLFPDYVQLDPFMKISQVVLVRSPVSKSVPTTALHCTGTNRALQVLTRPHKALKYWEEGGKSGSTPCTTRNQNR
jgi:hypothetical protein